MNRLYMKSILGALACTGIFPCAAHAFSFTTNFEAALTGADESKGDILLKSVEFGGESFSDFVFVDQANIVSNDVFTGGSKSGGASADKGDLATVGLSQENITAEQIVEAVGNPYLSSILDVEDQGSFAIDLFFDQAADQVFLWERGSNSRVDVQGLDADGNLVGDLLALDSADWDFAGYSLDTIEIREAQPVSSIGINLEDFGIADSAVAGVRLTSEGEEYNGPDLKVIGLAAEDPETVPEPTALWGLGLIAGLLTVRNRSRFQR
ncbi:MAG: exosortase-dependent surface protein XDP2 [Microcoleaceae cyanobacterium]